MQARRIALELAGVGADLLLARSAAVEVPRLLGKQQAEIAEASDADRTAEQVTVALRAERREIAAEAPADDAHPARVGDALADCPARPVDHVVVGQAAPVLVRGVEPVAAEAVGAAKVHLQHRIAAAREELPQEVVAPGVAVDRAAVRHHDQGQQALRPVLRQGQVARDVGAVARRVVRRLHVRQSRRIDVGERRAHRHGGMRLEVDDTVTRRADVAV